MVHTVGWRVASPEAVDFWEGRLADEGIAGERYADGALRLPRPRGPAARADPGREPGRAADRRPSRGAAGVRAPGLRRRARLRARPRAEPPLPRGDARVRAARRDGWEARGKQRGGLYLYDQSEERGVPGAGTVHHVAWASPTDEHEAWQRPRRRERRLPHAGDRPLLLQVDLLPRAERRPLRDRHDRPGFTADEPLETLGEQLSLPPNYEHLRDRLEGVLTPLPDLRALRAGK